MKLSKKVISTVVLTVAMSMGIATVQPRRAEAIAGAIGNPAAVFVGIATIAAGTASAVLGSKQDYFGGIGFILAGILFMDSGNGPALQFNALSTTQAKELGISKQELEAYNDSVEEVNSVAQDMSVELGQIKQPSIEVSRQAWLKHSADLDPVAAKVASLIATRAMETVVTDAK